MNYNLFINELLKMSLKDENSYLIRKYILEDNSLLFDIYLEKDELSLLTKYNGKLINSIRTLVQASGFIHDQNHIRIDIHLNEKALN
ncbi:MAG: hypothetical protein ACK5HL_03205 [Bacilli bacterium]